MLSLDGAGRSERRLARGSRILASGLLLMSMGSLGCWEQMSAEWFPQMKEQLAVQAFELDTLVGDGQGFTPPEGSVPLGNPAPDVASLAILEQEALKNPHPVTLSSLKKGEVLFNRYCITCHGPQGHGDGPVAGPPFGTGPFGLVMPIGGPSSIVKPFSDGHLYTTISIGRGRMPSYKRIPASDRWHLINFIRDLNGQRGRQ